MLVMSAIVGNEQTVDERRKNFLTEAEIEKFLRSSRKGSVRSRKRVSDKWPMPVQCHESAKDGGASAHVSAGFREHRPAERSRGLATMRER
jgi:hypothetical protein